VKERRRGNANVEEGYIPQTGRARDQSRLLRKLRSKKKKKNEEELKEKEEKELKELTRGFNLGGGLSFGGGG